MKRLGDAYSEVASSTAPNASADFAAHFKLVKRVAAHFRGRLPAAIEHSDLVQAGIVGLMEAIESFDPERGNDFETFAKLRIRGAMLDEIRRAAWAPRSTVKVAVEARAAATRIANEKGLPATHRQIADELGLDVGRYHELRGRNQGLAGSVTLEEINFASEEPTPDEVADEDSIRIALKQGIASLSEREKTVVALYYDRELTLREIGAVLSVSESRVSQMLTSIAKQLRALINGDANANGTGAPRPRQSSSKNGELRG
ncbi:MAG: FliA/WhiG family RNA polymerase sigma factor [Gammaproteobacteria bacterium]|jgi:RNA polymerase sigma factor FliA|nr:FliA/WhiG family RNA polymerase sigma factor [Gammaproteobacteria bacterium]